MTLLSSLSLHQQITYQPPTDAEVLQLGVEAFNKRLSQEAALQDQREALSLRFELEVARIRDLNESHCFWSIMQAYDIYQELQRYLRALNYVQTWKMLADLWTPELGFPDWFWSERSEQMTWGDWKKENPWEFLEYHAAPNAAELEYEWD